MWNFLVYARGMKYLMGYDTALEYWRTHGLGEQRSIRTSARFVDPPYGGLLESSALAGWATVPLHIVLTDKQACRHLGGVVCHVQSGLRALESMVFLEDGVFVAAPEMCFLQMAYRVHFIDLVQIGFELCGAYRWFGDSFITQSACTSVRKISGYLSCIRGVHGIKKARRATDYVLNGAESPMEAILVMLLCLPVSMGGYGLPRPVLNCPVDHHGKIMRSDLCWPKCGFALEYDSNLFHSGKEKLNADSLRRTQIELAKTHTISVTWEQLRDPFAFDELAKVVSRYLGHRVRTTREDALARRFALRRRLFRSSMA